MLLFAATQTTRKSLPRQKLFEGRLGISLVVCSWTFIQNLWNKAQCRFKQL